MSKKTVFQPHSECNPEELKQWERLKKKLKPNKHAPCKFS